ncbi:MAG: hypothetical protein HC810_05920 [Acaryochloridaceae cyanobacterium RL_2_7]|nr:hypothetical protein [Acaryochloridaceae cyanobacterium RL_2_7]
METIATPLGSIEVVSRPEAVVSIDFLDCHGRMTQLLFIKIRPSFSEVAATIPLGCRLIEGLELRIGMGNALIAIEETRNRIAMVAQ